MMQLPNEIIDAILDYVNAEDIFSCQLLCKQWDNAVRYFSARKNREFARVRDKRYKSLSHDIVCVATGDKSDKLLLLKFSRLDYANNIEYCINKITTDIAMKLGDIFNTCASMAPAHIKLYNNAIYYHIGCIRFSITPNYIYHHAECCGSCQPFKITRDGDGYKHPNANPNLHVIHAPIKNIMDILFDIADSYLR